MESFKKSVILVVLAFVVSGCGAIFSPQGGSNFVERKGPGYEMTQDCKKDDFGRTYCTTKENVNPQAVYGGYGSPIVIGNGMSPVGSPMNTRQPTPAYGPMPCVVSNMTGQQVCQGDGVVPFVQAGDESNPLSSPNGRQAVKDAQQDAQIRNTTRWATAADKCLRNGTCRK